MKEKLNKSDGITLIALVITIIVLLILAGISISFVIGNNGIITQAQNAVTTTRQATTKEELEIAYASCETAYYEAWAKDQSVDRTEFITKNFKSYIGSNGSLIGDVTIEEGSIKGTYKSNDQGTEYDFVISTDGEVLFVKVLYEQIKPENYGDPVNYAMDLNGNSNTTDDWSIFFKDEKGTYIIANNYLKTEKIPSGAEMSTQPPYTAYWSSLSENGAADIARETAEVFRLNWIKSYSSSTIENIKAVAKLMNTEIWKTFIPTELQSKGIKVIGSPTLEMWIDSWNEKYPVNTLFYNEYDQGYGVHGNEGVYGHYCYLGDYSGHNDDLYFPYYSKEQGCNGYWLAAPSFHGNEYVAIIYSDGRTL